MPEEEMNCIKRKSILKKILLKKLPILRWLPNYTKEDVIADFIAGITVGLTMIPQSVAYAGLAGLKPQYGLYTAFIGSIAYVIFGNIKEVSIGPTSLMALLTFGYVVGKPIEFVILLTFLAGCVELIMGLFKLGFLVDFISPCLTSGFTSATSIIIIVAQAKNLFGLSVKSHKTFPAIKELCSKIKDIKLGDTVLGISCIIFLILFKKFSSIKTESHVIKKIYWLLAITKNALAVFITTLISFIWSKSSGGSTPFKLTGVVPSGLPEIGLPSFHVNFNNSTLGFIDMVSELGSGIIVVPIVAVLANIAIASAYSADAVIDASQEMISLGLCNIFGAFVKAMPSCGAFTRSSVASSSDVRTPLQGIYSGTVIILALSFMAPFFFYIPKTTLAAILMVAACNLIDFKIYLTLWQCSKSDFFIALLTFFIGVFVSIEMSIAIGAAFNSMILLKSWSRPELIIEKKMFDAKSLEYLYIKPELGLFYPAGDYLTQSIKKAYKINSKKIPIVLDCYGILRIDYSGAKSLESLAKVYLKNILFININETVQNVLANVLDKEYLKRFQNSSEINILFPNNNNFNEIIEEECPLVINGNSSINSRRFSQDI